MPARSLHSVRLLYVVDRYWPSVGGIQLYVHHVARELASRHEVVVLACAASDGSQPPTIEGIPTEPAFEPFSDGAVSVLPLSVTRAEQMRLTPVSVQRLPVLRRYAYGRARVATAHVFARVVAPALARLERRAELVHMWGGGLLGTAAVRAARQLSVPVVMTPFAHRGQWGDDPASSASYRAADRVVGLLESDAELYARLGVPREKLEVVYVCSPGVQGGGGAALRARLGVDGKLVLFVGVRRPYKGFQLLREAADAVAAELPDVTFAWLGPGPAVAPSDTAPRVIDVGEVPDDERAAWLDAADLLCLPSDGEIFPNVFLEAWSVSTPVLGSDIATLTDLLTTSGGGIVAPRDVASLARAITSLLADPGRLAELASSGHDFWAHNATVDAVAAKYEAIYDELLARQGAECAA